MKVTDLFHKEYRTEEIAEKLLGKLLVHEKHGIRTSGFIVETEAYLGVPDVAAHSYGGRRTKRTETMFGKAGNLYAHVMHTHVLLNIITQDEGIPEGVLIRAVEPFEGIEVMEERRIKHGYHLTNGPGNLTKALGITMDYYGENIQSSHVFVSDDPHKIPAIIKATPRIGIPNKGLWTEKPLRFIVSGNPYVSRRKGRIDDNFGWKFETE